MIGKRIKVNDFKFKYGEETIYINVHGAFKYKKSGNKYVVYSYNNNKLCYGSLFIRDNELVIMLSKNDKEDIILNFIDDVLNENISNDYEIISLDKINSAQIIDEGTITKDYDTNKLYNLTMPKEEIKKENVNVKKKKSLSISSIFFMLFILVLGAFFFFNPEVIIGEDISYICTKEYASKELSATIKEETNFIFSGRGKIKSATLSTNYIFNNNNTYTEFKNEGLFYKYMEEGDTYKFIDDSSTFRIISKIDNLSEYFSFDTEDNLIKFYENNKYDCKIIETE